VFTGVGVGIFVAGLVGLGAGVSRMPPARAWLLLGACAGVVALATWPRIARDASSEARRGGTTGDLGADAWRLVACYGAFGFGYIVPATFLPAAARQLVTDPGVFGWAWPVFGLAAALSTLLCVRYARAVAPRRLWVGAQLAMAAGVIAPAVRTSLPTLLFSAVTVGGTFMVVTMAGLEEARRLAGPATTRLIATMTAAFALGQLLGPFTVRIFHSPAGAMALPSVVAGSALLGGLLALVSGPRRSRAPGGLSPRKGSAHGHAHGRPDASHTARADG
jgi:predicted MFS family arabinose efflux permease